MKITKYHSDGLGKRMLAILFITFMVTMIANPMITANESVNEEVVEITGVTVDMAPELEDTQESGIIWAPNLCDAPGQGTVSPPQIIEQTEEPESITDVQASGILFKQKVSSNSRLNPGSMTNIHGPRVRYIRDRNRTA
jgi:hypothetical protein